LKVSVRFAYRFGGVEGDGVIEKQSDILLRGDRVGLPIQVLLDIVHSNLVGLIIKDKVSREV
jgi:hypothetical protein